MALPLLAAASLGPVVATFIKFIVGTAITRVVAALGISLVTYASIDTVAGIIKSHMEANISGWGQWQAYIDAVGLPAAVNIIASAYIGAVSIRALMGAFNRITYGITGGQ